MSNCSTCKKETRNGRSVDGDKLLSDEKYAIGNKKTLFCCYNEKRCSELRKDDDECFMLCILPSIKKLSMKNKLEVRMLFQEILYDLVYQYYGTKSEDIYRPYQEYTPCKTIKCMDEDERYFFSLIPIMKTLKTKNKLTARIRMLHELNSIIQGKKIVRISHEAEGTQASTACIEENPIYGDNDEDAEEGEVDALVNTQLFTEPLEEEVEEEVTSQNKCFGSTSSRRSSKSSQQDDTKLKPEPVPRVSFLHEVNSLQLIKVPHTAPPPVMGELKVDVEKMIKEEEEKDKKRGDINTVELIEKLEEMQEEEDKKESVMEMEKLKAKKKRSQDFARRFSEDQPRMSLM